MHTQWVLFMFSNEYVEVLKCLFVKQLPYMLEPLCLCVSLSSNMEAIVYFDDATVQQGDFSKMNPNLSEHLVWKHSVHLYIAAKILCKYVHVCLLCKIISWCQTVLFGEYPNYPKAVRFLCPLCLLLFSVCSHHQYWATRGLSLQRVPALQLEH